MGNTLKRACAAFVLASAVGGVASAAPIATWGFEVVTPADAADTASYLGILPDSGLGVMNAVHASAATDWTTPAGPASNNAFSGNTWASGDYFQFQVSTLGLEDVTVSFDATGSNTGPRDFSISYSTDGSSFTSFASYQLVNAAWSALPSFINPATAHFDFNLSSITALDNDASIFIRLAVNSGTAINGSPTAAGGTSRVDNVVISAVPVPEPTTLGLLGLGSLGLLARRRMAR